MICCRVHFKRPAEGLAQQTHNGTFMHIQGDSLQCLTASDIAAMHHPNRKKWKARLTVEPNKRRVVSIRRMIQLHSLNAIQLKLTHILQISCFSPKKSPPNISNLLAVGEGLRQITNLNGDFGCHLDESSCKRNGGFFPCPK